jgi:hypothetical protein
MTMLGTLKTRVALLALAAALLILSIDADHARASCWEAPDMTIEEMTQCAIQDQKGQSPPSKPKPGSKGRLSLGATQSKTYNHGRRVCDSIPSPSSGFCWGVTDQPRCFGVSRMKARCAVQISYRPPNMPLGTRKTCSWVDRWRLINGRILLTTPEPNCPT